METLKLKNKLYEILKFTAWVLQNRYNRRNSEFEDIEIIQSEEQREKKMENVNGALGTCVNTPSISASEVPGGEERQNGTKKYLKKIIARSPDLVKDIDIQMQKDQ